jgi:hypothetical protein
VIVGQGNACVKACDKNRCHQGILAHGLIWPWWLAEDPIGNVISVRGWVNEVPMSRPPARAAPDQLGPSARPFAREPVTYDPGRRSRHGLPSVTLCRPGSPRFVTTQKIIAKEVALSGSEQNPDLTNKNVWQLLSRIWQTPEPIEKFKNNGVDFVVPDNLTDLVTGMNKLTGDNLIDLAGLRGQIEARDREIDNPYTKDVQVQGIRNALSYIGDSLSRTAPIHKILDTSAGPLISRPRPVQPPVRSRASAAAGCTDTARWRAPSSAAASSPAGRRAARRPRRRRPDGKGRESPSHPLPTRPDSGTLDSVRTVSRRLSDTSGPATPSPVRDRRCSAGNRSCS